MAIYPANGQPQGPPQGITRIAVSGFKSLSNKVDVEIRPLTVLAGANSSGKSALMQPLLLMKQTLESDVIPAGPFLLSGPYARYTVARQFLSRFNRRTNEQGVLTIDFGLGAETIGFTYASSDHPFELVQTRGSIGEDSQPWQIERDSTSNYLKVKFPALSKAFQSLGMEELSATRTGFYHQIVASTPDQSSPSTRQLLSFGEIEVFLSRLRSVIYVPGLRGDRNRKWLLTEVPSAGIFKGPFEPYVPSLIDSWGHADDRKRIDELKGGLRLLGLASDIATMRANESEVEVLVPLDPKHRDNQTAASRGEGEVELSFELTEAQAETVEAALKLAMKRGARDRGEALVYACIKFAYANIADVGLAISTALPILVALIEADPGQLVYLEHPELNLHPRAQWNLAQLLVQAANRGVRLVIETHSSLLLQGIMTEVAKGGISRENVALHWFARDEEGITKVTTADIDAEGRFGDWPADFDDVELKATNAYLDAVETKLMERKGAA